MSFSLFALLDDITATVDKIAVTAQRTSSLVADDIAAGTEGFIGVVADKEIPLVVKILKLSLINKLIILPIILGLSYFLPVLIMPLVILGASYLSYEGAEKVIHYFNKSEESGANDSPEDRSIDERIKDARLVDAVLSFEILLISLNVVKNDTFVTQVIVLSVIAVISTFFIYGVVLALLRLDDGALHMIKRGGSLEVIGRKILKIIPYVMKLLAVVGCFAMLLVGGELLLEAMHHYHLGVLIDFIESIVSSSFVHALLAIILSFILGSILYTFIHIGKKNAH